MDAPVTFYITFHSASRRAWVKQFVPHTLWFLDFFVDDYVPRIIYAKCHCPSRLTPLLSLPFEQTTSSGEELSIDYGSTEKGMYRFARTYGFVTRAHNPSGRPESESPPNDTMRVRVRLPTPNRSRTPPAHEPKHAGVSRDAAGLPVDAEQRPKSKDAGHVLRTAAGAGQNKPGGDESGGGTADGEARHGEDEETKDVEVWVRLADVSNALLGHEKSPSGGNMDLSLPGASGKGKADAEWKLVVSRALEDRLRRYSTSLEDDLQVPRRATGKRNIGLGTSEGVDREVFTSSDRNERERSVTPEWVDMCVSIRAAEKIALRRALAEVRELSSA